MLLSLDIIETNFSFCFTKASALTDCKFHQLVVSSSKILQFWLDGRCLKTMCFNLQLFVITLCIAFSAAETVKLLIKITSFILLITVLRYKETKDSHLTKINTMKPGFQFTSSGLLVWLYSQLFMIKPSHQGWPVRVYDVAERLSVCGCKYYFLYGHINNNRFFYPERHKYENLLHAVELKKESF